eukprot:COSAG01_NODE_2402_length_7759_cov_9.960313_12_plen_69_part_00
MGRAAGVRGVIWTGGVPAALCPAASLNPAAVPCLLFVPAAPCRSRLARSVCEREACLACLRARLYSRF